MNLYNSPSGTEQQHFRTSAAGGPFSAFVEYEFKRPREPEDAIMPGCVVKYEITYQGGSEVSTIKFALKDYDLARQHRIEVDRQFMKALCRAEYHPCGLQFDL